MLLTHRIRILVLHDDPVTRAGLAAALLAFSDFDIQNWQHQGPAASLDDILRQELATDVVVADYLNGVALSKFVMRQANMPVRPKVVVVAGSDREWEIRTALENGVRGYLLIGCAIEELAASVRTAHKDAVHLSRQIASRLADSIAFETLTSREEQVLRLVVEGFSNKVIGQQLGIAVGTVKSHLKSAFEKLHVQSRTQAIVAVERRGLFSRDRGMEGHRAGPQSVPGSHPSDHPGISRGRRVTFSLTVGS